MPATVFSVSSNAVSAGQQLTASTLCLKTTGMVAGNRIGVEASDNATLANYAPCEIEVNGTRHWIVNNGVVALPLPSGWFVRIVSEDCTGANIRVVLE
jgi:hypothetical protein